MCREREKWKGREEGRRKGGEKRKELRSWGLFSEDVLKYPED